MEESPHQVLSDPRISFVRKLTLAAGLELVLWENRTDPPNLSVIEFQRILPLIPVSLQPAWAPRKSDAGRYGKTGEKLVFKFEFDVTFFGRSQVFFVKGYFFEEDNLKGVEIQSFRKRTSPKLRMV